MATAVIEIVATFIAEISKLLIVPLKKQVGYLAKYHNIIEDLRRATNELRMFRNSSKCAMDEALRRGDAVIGTMVEWLKQVDTTLYEAQKVLDCDCNSRSCCTNTRARYLTSRRALNLAKLVTKLKNSGERIPFSRPTPPPSIEVMPTGDFEAFESTKEVMSRIIEALGHDLNRLVGVYGMGGVGKTSIIREVARHTKITNMFDEVVIATVSQNPDLKNIQSEIAEGLGLRLEEKTEHIRSLRLAERLKKQESRVLIILDDVWERLELSQIGIPFGKDNNNCKIVITTRNLDVCSEMYCNVSIKVDVLLEEDSWSLFKKVATDIVDSPDLIVVAKEIARECAGLPIALVTLGRVLRNKEKQMWEDALHALKESKPLNIKGMHEKVFSCLQLSFDQAQTEEAKLFYLYCSMFPEDYDVSVEDLLRYGIGEGLFSDEETIDEARHRVDFIISNLKASCLLLSSKNEKRVKMHDVFRDLAISIATNNDFCFMVKASSGLTEWPRKLKLEYVMRMSLMNNEFSSFHGQRNYPDLLLLLLQNNKTLKAISDDFFAGMGSLLVLDLSNIPNLVALPSSLSSLTNLRTLCVENNHLKDGYPLAGLHSLEILSLKKTSFAAFPQEIQKLTNLRLLDLTDSHLGIIPDQVIPRLCHLEELYMEGSFDGWEIKESDNNGRATLTEVLSLENLNTLHIDIGNYHCLTEEITCHCPRLRRFQINIGSRVYNQTAHSKSLRFNVPDNFRVPKPFASWVNQFIQRMSKLSVMRWKNLTSLEQLQISYFQFLNHLLIQQCDVEACFSDSMFERFKDMQEVKILSCYNMHSVFFCNKYDPEHDIFPRIERLDIYDAPKLTALWRGAVPSVCFTNLRHVAIESCEQIKIVFPLPVAEALKQLQCLEISNCVSLEAMICNGNYEIEDTSATQNTRALFPQLQSLKLRYLERLSCLTRPWYHLDLTSLKHVNVRSCPNLKKLPFKSKIIQTLVEIKAEKKWFDELELEDENMKILLQEIVIDTRA